MSAITNNVNLNPSVNDANTGAVYGYLEPSLIRAIIFVPKNTVILAASMVDPATFATFVNGKLTADSRTDRWYAITNLDRFEDQTKAITTDDTGLIQTNVTKFAPKYSFQYLASMGNFIELLKFNNSQSQYDYYFVDANGTWNGCAKKTATSQTTGLKAYTSSQIWVNDIKRTTVSTINAYMLSVQALDRMQYNENFKYYAAGTDLSTLQGFQNVWLADETSTLSGAVTIVSTTTVLVTAKFGQFSTDLYQYYPTQLTAACYVAYNLTTGASATIASVAYGTVVVTGQTYNYCKIVLSSAPTAGDVVQFKLAAPSAVNAVIPGANIVDETPFPTQNSYNAAVHTF